MSHRIVILVSGVLLAGDLAAQNVDSPRLREAMVATATQLLETVAGGPGPIELMAGYDRRSSLAYLLDDPERENWQYWPAQRIGLSLELMTADQRRLAHNLLNTVLSSSGYLKAAQIMQLERILLAIDEAGFPRSVGHYKLAIFGTPSVSSDWAWRFEGHHVSLSVSVAPDGIAVTPSFFGSNPAEVRTGPLAGLRVHGALEDMARELVTSLDDSERALAIVSDRAPGEIFTTQLRVEREQWREWINAVQPQGVAVRDLNEVQQHWVARIVEEVVGNYRKELREQYLDEIEVEDLRFAWMGSVERGEPHYFRIQGGDFVYEYDNVQNRGNHVHAVWRSRSTDFGMGVLESHYQSARH